MATTMTRQHFQAIAEDFGLALRRNDQALKAGAISDDEWQIRYMEVVNLAKAMTDTFRRFNSGFDADRFFGAIGKVENDGLA